LHHILKVAKTKETVLKTGELQSQGPNEKAQARKIVIPDATTRSFGFRSSGFRIARLANRKSKISGLT